MSLQDIKQRIKKIVAEQLGVNEGDITDTAVFVDDFGADSLDEVELAMALEDEFEMEIPDQESKTLTTVDAIANYIWARPKT